MKRIGILVIYICQYNYNAIQAELTEEGRILKHMGKI